jgi:hypothetical protein
MAAQAQTTEIEIISVPEWCRRVGCSLDAATGQPGPARSPASFGSAD